MGNETPSRGDSSQWVCAGVKTRAIEAVSESAFVPASGLHNGFVEILPGELGNSASAFISSQRTLSSITTSPRSRRSEPQSAAVYGLPV